MRLCSVMFLLGSLCRSEGAGLAEMISNYAKVAVSGGNTENTTSPSPFSNFSSTTPLPTTTTNYTEEDDDIPEYEDFDDLQESKSASGYDSSTALKYLNGVVNLLALMYSFNGRKSSLNPESWHFGSSRPRDGGRDGLAENINDLAQDRFHPTTATKKFKLQQGYSSVDTFPPYDPYAQTAAESYNSNGGKTSYDSDDAMYMISPPKSDAMTIKNTPKIPALIKNPMKDYMAQNNDVDIQPSYSYQIPDPLPQVKDSMAKMKAPGYYYGIPLLPTPSPPAPEKDVPTYPWMMKDHEKNMMPDDHGHEHYDDDRRPVYYPWMSNTAESKPKPMEDDKPQWMGGSPDDDDQSDPAYHPWMMKPKKKAKPAPPPPQSPEEDDENDDQPWATKGKYPDHDHVEPPPSLDGPPPYYPYIDDHHHFIDDHHQEHDEEEDHQMKDEDRESKRPYTYYHLGRKLWYIPLLFSVYFILYIGSLILKSIAKHKVQLPEKLWELHENDHHHDHDRRRHRQIDEIMQRVYDGIEEKENKFM